MPTNWKLSECALKLRRAIAAGVLCSFTAVSSACAQLVELAIDPTASHLTVTAKTLGLMTSPVLSDNMRSLSGSITAGFIFGINGEFPEEAHVEIIEAEIAADGDFDVVIGQPPAFFAEFFFSDLLMGMETLEPAAPMQLVPETSAVYSVDSAGFAFPFMEGIAHFILDGVVDESVDFSGFDPPISTVPPTGTLGSLTLTELSGNGFYSEFDVAWTLPVDLKTRIIYGGNLGVDVSLEGEIVANGTGYFSLTGIPGDFNHDLRVHQTDLPVWEEDFGEDFDGIDLLLWQRNFGTAPPTGGAVAAAPEPGGLALSFIGAGLILAGLRPVACSRIALERGR